MDRKSELKQDKKVDWGKLFNATTYVPEDKGMDEQDDNNDYVPNDQGMNGDDNSSTYYPDEGGKNDDDNSSTDTEELLKHINEPHEDAVKRLLGAAPYKLKQSKLPFKNNHGSQKEMPTMLKALSQEISPTKKYQANKTKNSYQTWNNRYVSL